MNRRGESTQISTPLDAMDSSTGALEFRDNNNGGGGGGAFKSLSHRLFLLAHIATALE